MPKQPRGNKAFVWSHEYTDRHVIPPHCHSKGQLIHAISGLMEIVTEQHFFLVPSQRGIWIPPGVTHQMRARGVVTLRTVYVDILQTDVKLPTTPKSIQVSNLLRELIISASDFSCGGQTPASPKRAFLTLSLILEELAASPDTTMGLPVATDPRLSKLCNALQADPGDKRSLEEWSKTIGASARTLSRLFHHELSCSFITWRQQLRVLSAIGRLSAGESVTEVAYAVGYDTHGAFSAMFRKITGVNPSSYFPKDLGKRLAS